MTGHDQLASVMFLRDVLTPGFSISRKEAET
jgi:hypothetical protein